MEQAEPRADQIMIVVIAVFTYRLYRVHACMQGLWDVDIELWAITVYKLCEGHVLQETIMGMLLIPGLH